MDGQGPHRAQEALKRRGLAAVAAVQLLLSLAVASKPLDVDEPLYYAMAGQALRDPARPGGLSYFWEGRRDLVSRIVPSSPLPGFLYAPFLAASGGEVRRMRLLLIPVDMAVAALLFLLAARFLRRPLLPVLAVLVSPGWWLTVPALLLEKWMLLFGLSGLLAAVRGRLWLSAALVALSCLCKNSGVVFAAAAVAWLWSRGEGPARLAGWLALALGPAGAWLALGLLDPERLRSFALHARPASAGGAIHRWRALLAFASGCVPSVAVAAFGTRLPGRKTVAAAVAGAALFVPLFDALPATLSDRFLGLALGATAGAALAAAWSRRTAGRALWLGLGASAALIQGFVYWSVAGRFSLLLSLALAFGLAERLELERRRRSLAWGGLALSLLLGLPSIAADYVHAAASEAAARDLSPDWFTGHWGLQHYMQQAGARPLEGSWASVRPGDRVVVPGVNANVLQPVVQVQADLLSAEPRSMFPLLTMCGARWRCQAGFHSSAYGFLPYSFTDEPVDRFDVVDLRR